MILRQIICKRTGRGGLERNTYLIMRAAATQLLPLMARRVGWPRVDRFVSIISSMVNLSFTVQILEREISLISPAYRLIDSSGIRCLFLFQ